MKKFFKKMKAFLSKYSTIPSRRGEEAPPEGTPAHYMISNIGLHMGVWLSMWNEITEKEGPLHFPRFDTFNLRIIGNLR